MSEDLISRQAAIRAICEKSCLSLGPCGAECTEVIALKELPSAQPEQRWIPVKTRPMTEEERKYYLEELGWRLDDNEMVMFDSLMPGDGQEVWVCSKSGNVWHDTCVIDGGIGLDGNDDWMDIVAWMPYERPEPWKGEDDAEND